MDSQHPKELWVHALGRGALRQLRAPVLAERFREGGHPLPPPVPVKTEQMSSLASFLRERLRDPRDPHGVRHPIVSVVATASLAVAAHLPKMDLTGVLVIGDAAHTTKANCRQLSQAQGADYLFFLYERQRGDRNAKGSLPDWQRRNHRTPKPLIDLFTAQRRYPVSGQVNQPRAVGGTTGRLRLSRNVNCVGDLSHLHPLVIGVRPTRPPADSNASLDVFSS